MKLRTFLAMAIIALCTVSCSDDDDVKGLDNQVEVSTQVAGSYEGVTQLAVGGSSQGAFDGTLKIESQKDGKVSLVFPEIKMSPKMSLQSFKLEDVEVKSVSANEFMFEHTTFTVEVGGMDYVSTKGLKGTLKDGVLDLTYDIKPGGMPMSIDVVFTNDKDKIFASKVVGSYKGATFLSVMKSASAALEGAVEIEAQEGGKFTIVTPAAALGGPMSMPNLTIKDVVIKSTGANEYSLESESFSIKGDNITYVSEKGLNGTLKDGKLSLEYAIKPGEMPMAIDHLFTMDETLVSLAAISKSYEGAATLKVMGKESGSSDAEFTLTAQANGKMKVSFPSVGEAPMALSEFSLADVTIESVGENEFKLSHDAFTVTVKDEAGQKMKYVGSKGLTGTLKDGVLTFDYAIKPGEMPMPIDVHFGEKKAVAGDAAKIAGSYAGKTTMYMSGKESGSFEGTFKLEAQADGKLTIVSPSAKITESMSLPEVTVKDIEVKMVSEKEYTLELGAFTLDLGDGKKCVSEKGIKGAVKDGILTLNYDFKIGGMPFSIDFKFESTK